MVRAHLTHLPHPSQAGDADERLLLAPPVPVFGPEKHGFVGRLVAQSMLLGGLHTPGQGMSGGLAVLLGGLGNRLAATDGISGVITVVTAGHEDLAADDRLAHERAHGHWVLWLPVDAPSASALVEMHRHRPALIWWAVRLLGAMPRPLDVLHVRYADDGSLALADAAEGLGAALVFTAIPDPHRGLAERHAASDPADPTEADALRHDLHRVFLADRLVERADTVVGIPGRGGTSELARHFPRLARLNEGRGPSARLKASLSTGPHPTRTTSAAVSTPSSPRTRKARAAWHCCRLCRTPRYADCSVPWHSARPTPAAGMSARAQGEEFGIAVLEAMDAGLPVAGPRRGGVAHYLRDQVNGLLMDTSGQAGLLRALRRDAATSVDERRRYAAAGRKLVAERFSVTRMADEPAAEYAALHTG